MSHPPVISAVDLARALGQEHPPTDEQREIIDRVTGMMSLLEGHADVVMENLIGDDMDRVPALLATPDTQLHLYGKADVKPGRKMGHVNRILRGQGA